MGANPWFLHSNSGRWKECLGFCSLIYLFEVPRTCSQYFWTFVRPKYRPRMVPSFLNINSCSILYHQCRVITSWSTFTVLFFPPLWPPLRTSRQKKKKKALPSSKGIKEGTKHPVVLAMAVAISLTSLYGWCNHRKVALFSKLRALWFCLDHSACQEPFTPSSMYYVLSTFLHSKNEHSRCHAFYEREQHC